MKFQLWKYDMEFHRNKIVVKIDISTLITETGKALRRDWGFMSCLKAGHPFRC